MRISNKILRIKNYDLSLFRTMKLLVLVNVLVLILTLQIGCSRDINDSAKEVHIEYDKLNVKYASGFELYEAEDHFKMVFYNLEDSTAQPHISYFYSDSTASISIQKKVNSYMIPLGAIALESTTHASYLLKLGLEDYIKGIAYAQFVQDSLLKGRIEQGEIENISAAENLDTEKLLRINVQALTISPFSTNSMEIYGRIGVPVIVISEYLEKHPLATAEWIKVFGLMYGKLDEANLIFDQVEARYNTLKDDAQLFSYEPSVIIGSEYNGQWSMPGGESNISTIIEDAGARYIFSGKKGIANQQIDIEVLLDKASEVDFWGKIGAGEVSLNEFGLDQTKVGAIKAVRDGKLFYCNSTESDYFVKACIQPDVILADLINILQPVNEGQYQGVYFKLID